MKTDGSKTGNGGNNTPPPEDRKEEGEGTLKQQLFKFLKPLEMALPKGITPERIQRIAMTALQTNKNLAACETRSFLGALLTAAQLGLEPNTPLGHCYLIPRWSKKINGYECTFQMGYQGMLELAYRSRLYKRISAKVVYAGDVFSYEYGKNHHLKHEPKWKSQEPLFVYADYEIENGGYDFTVWNWGAIMRHAKDFSDSIDSSYSPWKSNPEEMAKKTAMKSLLKYGPRSIEIAADMSSAINYDGNVVAAKKIEDGTVAAIQYEVLPPENAPAKTANETGKTAGAAAESSPAEKERDLKDSSLFSRDEAAHLEEQYQMSRSGVEPPAF